MAELGDICDLRHTIGAQRVVRMGRWSREVMELMGHLN